MNLLANELVTQSLVREKQNVDIKNQLMQSVNQYVTQVKQICQGSSNTSICYNDSKELLNLGTFLIF